MKRLFCILFAVLLAVPLAACGGANTNEPAQTAAVQTTEAAVTEPEETGRAAVRDDLPDKDYKNATFTILDRTKYDDEFYSEEETGEVMNDAIYNRNLKTEERFRVKLKTNPMDCNWGDQATAWNNALTASVMAGDGAYDLIAGYAATIPALVSSKIFFNWAELPYVDFTKPWWSEKVAEELTINGKTFMAAGDLSTALWKGMTCLFFNKQVAEDYKIEDFYGLVRDGKWTFDKLIEFTKDTYKDLDGDGKMTEADQYGLLCGYDIQVDCMKEAFEVNVTVKGSDGFPVLAYNNEHTVEVVQKVNNYIHNSGTVLFNSSIGAKKQEAISSEDRALLITEKLGSSNALREMESDFGIIPYPKWDDKQASYHSTSHDEFSVFLVPIDVKDKERTAVVTVGMSAENYRTVIPAFYDVALKTKNARDEESAEMIDLIRDTLVFNFGYLHSGALGSVGHLFVSAIRKNDNAVASGYAAKVATYEEKLAEVLSVYRN